VKDITNSRNSSGRYFSDCENQTKGYLSVRSSNTRIPLFLVLVCFDLRRIHTITLCNHFITVLIRFMAKAIRNILPKCPKLFLARETTSILQCGRLEAILVEAVIDAFDGELGGRRHADGIDCVDKNFDIGVINNAALGVFQVADTV
jgi:hypothetical protein